MALVGVELADLKPHKQETLHFVLFFRATAKIKNLRLKYKKILTHLNVVTSSVEVM